MLRSIVDSDALRAARVALGGLTRRQEAISANIANVETPGYERRSVEFERDLEAALQRSTVRTSLATTDPRHVTSAAAGDARNPNHVTPREVIAERNDGNEVNLDEEMALLAETQLRYQALTTTVARRLATLRGVIRG